jgi:hypothetical protein
VHVEAAAVARCCRRSARRRRHRAQAGDLLIAFGQRALQVAIRVAADLVRTRQRRDALLELGDARILAGATAPRGSPCDGTTIRHSPQPTERERARNTSDQRIGHAMAVAAVRRPGRVIADGGGSFIEPV